MFEILNNTNVQIEFLSILKSQSESILFFSQFSIYYVNDLAENFLELTANDIFTFTNVNLEENFSPKSK